MSKFLTAACLLMGIAGTAFGTVHYEILYPASVQPIIFTDTFRGDSHGQFYGDYVAILADGSAWKIHPKDRELYESWSLGDRVRVMYRTDFYWIKREHKYWLHNHSNGQQCRVMIAQHSNNPWKHIVATDIRSHEELVTQTIYEDGQSKEVKVWALVPYAKIIRLNDGSLWKIENRQKFDLYQVGTPVFVGVQGTPGDDYDFLLIVGLEREARCTRAKLHY